MSSAIETVRLFAPWCWSAVLWPMLWQSSLLIGVLLALDIGLRRKLRPAVRYALWLAVLLKLVLPPSLALPTGIAWWLRPAAVAVQSHRVAYSVSYGPAEQPGAVTEATVSPASPLRPRLPMAVWALLGSLVVSCGLLAWMLRRWRQAARVARQATAAPQWLNELLEETRRAARLRRAVQLKLTPEHMSPAVCGFFRPLILLPQALAERLPSARLRAVLLHELMHLRRGDLWVNCAQALLQIAYWWHPLLWVANSRIRRLREEAVDDAVMKALKGEGADYAPTLLEVARLALQRPRTSLGLVGILESKTALRRRIERLAGCPAPRRAGLTLLSLCGVGLFAALAVPMGQAPARSQVGFGNTVAPSRPWPDPRFQGYARVRLESEFLIADTASLRAVLPALFDNREPLVVGSNDVNELDQRLALANAQPPAAGGPVSFPKFSGGLFRWVVGGVTNIGVNYQAKDAAGGTVVTGAEIGVAASRPDWAPLRFCLVPWTEGEKLRCQMELSSNGDTNNLQPAEAVLPQNGALVWATPTGPFTGKSELVVLRRQPTRNSVLDISGKSMRVEPFQVRPVPETGYKPTGLADATNRVPVLGDLPVVGRLFQSNAPSAKNAAAAATNSSALTQLEKRISGFGAYTQLFRSNAPPTSKAAAQINIIGLCT